MVEAPERYANVALALGCTKGVDDYETAKKGIEKIKELITECKVIARLRDLDIPQSAIPTMAKDALKIQRLLKNNPRHISEEDAIDIYNEAY